MTPLLCRVRHKWRRRPWLNPVGHLHWRLACDRCDTPKEKLR